MLGSHMHVLSDTRLITSQKTHGWCIGFKGLKLVSLSLINLHTNLTLAQKWLTVTVVCTRKYACRLLKSQYPSTSLQYPCNEVEQWHLTNLRLFSTSISFLHNEIQTYGMDNKHRLDKLISYYMPLKLQQDKTL